MKFFVQQYQLQPVDDYSCCISMLNMILKPLVLHHYKLFNHCSLKMLNVITGHIHSNLFPTGYISAETGHASIQPHDPTGTSNGAPRIRQQPCVSSWDAWSYGPIPEEAGPPTDSAGSAATEPQPAVSLSSLWSRPLKIMHLC